MNHRFYINMLIFLYCTSTSLQTFLNEFAIKHIDQSIWSRMKERFEYSIELKSNTRKQNHHFKSAQKFQFIKGIIFENKQIIKLKMN